MNFIQKLEESLHKGFINQKHNYNGSFAPKLLVNNTKNNENVLSTILEELENVIILFFSSIYNRKWTCYA